MQGDCEVQAESVGLEDCEMPEEPFGSLLDKLFPKLACIMLIVVVYLLVHTIVNGG
tara:strand:+ start:199 stop:366 length:168 start_codon:yes stop_codon:yes gene_type:complete